MFIVYFNLFACLWFYFSIVLVGFLYIYDQNVTNEHHLLKKNLKKRGQVTGGLRGRRGAKVRIDRNTL